MQAYCIPLATICIFSLCIVPAFSATLSLWVNSTAIGQDIPVCGVNYTLPCTSLNYTLARALELTYEYDTIDSLVVFLQAPVYSEVVNFEDSNLTFKQIILRAEDYSTSSISYSNIKVLAPVEFWNFVIDSSLIFAWQLKLDNSNISQSFLHGLPIEINNSSLPSNTTITGSSFVDTRGIYQGVSIYGASFSNSPVHVMSDVCDIGSSTFVNANTTALTTQACIVRDSFFGNNTGENGGAIYAYSELQVQSCNFSRNTALLNGGAIFSDGYLNIFESLVDSNSATSGGGIYITGTSGYLDCSNSVVSSNVAAYGGGIAVRNGSIIVHAGCRLLSNEGLNGGGLHISNSSFLGDGFWLFADCKANVGGAVYIARSQVELGGGFSGNTAEEATGIYAEDSALELNSVEFEHSEGNGTYLVELMYSSSKLASWTSVHFLDVQEVALFCNDCANIVCSAKENCDDCTQGCLEFNSSSLCATSHGANFGCFGSSTCAHVSVNGTVCKCEPGFHGDLCSERNSEPSKGFPAWAIVLIAVGGLSLIAVFIYAVVRFARKKEYKAIE